MFDMTNLRVTTLDQLRPWSVYRLKADLRAVDGRLCPSGMEFRFEFAIVNSLTEDAEVHGLDPEGAEVVILTRSGWHKEVFAGTGRQWRPQRKAEPPPSPGEDGDRDAWLAWLERQPEYRNAAGILSGQRVSTGDWGADLRDADTLCAAARALAKTNPAVARWVAGRSLDLYHCWMSQATSGGEGTAMQYQVRNELDEMRRLTER